MDWYWYLIIAAALFGFGFWAGVATLHKTWIKPSLDRGILDIGHETYKMSRIVKRNTRL